MSAVIKYEIYNSDNQWSPLVSSTWEYSVLQAKKCQYKNPRVDVWDLPLLYNMECSMYLSTKAQWRHTAT